MAALVWNRSGQARHLAAEMSAVPMAGPLCNRCNEAAAVWRGYCLACRDRINPTIAVQERFLMLLRDLARRRMVTPGQDYEFNCQFKFNGAEVEMYDATLRTPTGDLAFRQQYADGRWTRRREPRWRQALRVLRGR